MHTTQYNEKFLSNNLRQNQKKIIQLYEGKAQKGSHKRQYNEFSQIDSTMVNFFKVIQDY